MSTSLLACLLLALPHSLLACVYGDEFTTLNFTNQNVPIYNVNPEHSPGLTTYLSICKPLRFKKVYSHLLPCNGNMLCTFNGTTVVNTASRQLPYYVQKHRGSSITLVLFGNRCHNRQFRADITFYCSESWGSPHLIPTQNECSMKIIWPSPSGCSIHQTKKLMYTDSICQIGDESTKFLYDFKADQDFYFASNTRNIQFAIKPCGGIHPHKTLPHQCWGKTVCLIKDGHVISAFEDPLNITKPYDGYFEKVYNAPVEGCAEYRTTIRFFCKNYAVVERGPFLSSSGRCWSIIDWYSMAACPLFSRPTCTVKGPNNIHLYDLTPIVVPSNTYWLPQPGGQYKEVQMDICSILAWSNEFSTYNGAFLKPGQITVESQATTEYYDFNRKEEKRLLLEYIDYQPCLLNPSQKVTYKIEMICSHSIYHSRPIYVKTEGCVHHSIWPHIAGCSLGKAEPADCSVRNPATGYIYSLEKLRGQIYALHLPGTSDSIIQLQVCQSHGLSSSTSCGQNVGACLTQRRATPVNLGMANSHLEYCQQSLVLKYTWGDKCPSLMDDRHATIIFYCGSEDSGPQFLSSTDDCSYAFTWTTPLACQRPVGQQQSETGMSRYFFYFLLSFMGFLLLSASILGILTCIPKTRVASAAIYAKFISKSRNEQKESETNSECSKPLHSSLERPFSS